MELEQLRQLCTVAEAGTVSAAAEALRLSQPALSRSLQRLERELGVRLFDRTANRLALNEAGRIALRHAEDVLRDERRLRDAMANYARNLRSLRVGTCAPAPLWRLTERVLAADPAVLLSTEMLPEADLVRLLAEGALDAALLMRPVHVPGIKASPFMVENLSVSMPAAHPLSGRESLSFADIDGERFLLYAGVGAWREVCERHMPNARYDEQGDYMVFRSLQAETPLLTFWTDQAGAPFQQPGRVAVPLSDADAHITFYLATRPDADGRWGALLRACSS